MGPLVDVINYAEGNVDRSTGIDFVGLKFAYSLCNCYGATMKIKGSLLLSTPIVKHFQAKKTKSSFGQNLTVFGNK